MRSRPAPPYSSGTVSPNRPSSFICSTIFSGNSSRASSSSATGKTSRSTNSRTVATTACCSSESSTRPPGPAPAMRLALCSRGREVLEPLAPLHPRGPPPHGELLGHLAAGLVDHLGPEHDRSRELDVGGVPVGLQHGFGLVELFLARGEHFVQHVDLRGVERPLSVVTQGPGPQDHLAKPVQVLDDKVRAVDRLEARVACGHQNAGQDEVPVVPRIARHGEAGRDRRQPEGRAHVGGPKMSVSARSDASAMASIFVIPVAVSIWISTPIRFSSPVVSSIIRSRSATNATSVADSTFGIMMQSRYCPAFSTTSITSR